jgi:hypothetical protein
MSIILDVYRDSGWEIPLNHGELFKRFFEKWFNREGIKLRKTSSTTRTMFMFGLTGGIAYMMHNRGEIRTSREKIWSHICRYLEEQIVRNIVSSDRYKADELLDELLGMGLFIESENRIKFYHQLFQEFFAAVHLADQNPEEALMRFSNSWWEESLLFYSGLVENCSNLVKHAFESGDIVFAAHILSVSQNCQSALFTAVIRRLIRLLFDKFAYNRKQAYNYLLVIRNRQIDSILNEIAASTESVEHKKTISVLIADRKKRFKGIMQYPGSDLYDSAKFHDKYDPHYLREQHVSYSGSVAGYLRTIEKEILKNGVESGFSMFKEFAGTIGYAAVIQELRKLIQSVESANRMLFLTWCLSILLEKRGVDVLLEDFRPEAVSEIFHNAVCWKTLPDKRTRLLINILFNADTERLWQLEIAQYELLCNDDPEKEKHFGSALEANLENISFGKPHFEFLFQIFWDIDSVIAESYMIGWLKTRLDTLTGKSIVTFLSRQGVGAEHIETCIELMKESPKNLHPFFPEMITKTGSNKAAGFLMNVIQNKLYSLPVRGAAIQAFRRLADPEDKIFLEELINSIEPEIYDPAYEILMEIKKRASEDMKMFKAESADDVNIELLFDEEPAAVWSRPRVCLFRNDLPSAEINGVRIHFGPVSGRIFHFLAKNSNLGRYYNAADIRSHLEIQDLVLDDSSVRNRITDIRKRIQTALEGRVEPGLLLENARRFGYRINAEVEIK